jgi:hypothetical protein
MTGQARGRRWRAILVAVLAVASACSGAGGRGERDDGVADLASLVAALEATGLEVVEGQPVEQPFLSVPGRSLRLHGEDVLAFEYRDVAARAADSEKISPDARTVGTTMIGWIAPARFWAAGRLLVLYVGTRPEVIDALSTILGAPLAGPNRDGGGA